MTGFSVRSAGNFTMNQLLDHTTDGRSAPDLECQPERMPPHEGVGALASPWDIAAFWNLWAQHRDHLYRVCLRHTDGNHAEAEDALAEAMLKARKSLVGSAEVLQMPKAWLSRLTQNLCIDLGRAKARRRRLEDQAAEAITDDWGNGVSAAVSSDAASFGAQEQDRVRRLIETLPVRWREPFLLHLVEQKPSVEVAARLGLSASCVRKRVQLARARLRRLLREEAEEPGPPVSPPSVASSELRAPPNLASASAPGWEITFHARASEVVPVPLACGMVRCFHVFLEGPSSRERQKLAALRAYVRRHPGGWRKRLQLADCLHRVGAWAEAIAEWQQVLAEQPRLIQVVLRMAEVLTQTGANAAAAKLCTEALEHVRQSASRAHLRGWVALCQAEYATAEAEFQAATLAEAGNPAHALRWAQVQLKRGAAAGAVRLLESVLRSDPFDLIALSLLQEALLQSGRMEESMQRSQDLLARWPEDARALQHLVACRTQLGLITGEAGVETRRLLRRLWRLVPSEDFVLGPLTAFHLATGERQKGLAQAEQWVREHPQCARAWNHYLRVLTTEGVDQDAGEAKARLLAKARRTLHRCQNWCGVSLPDFV